MVDAHDIRRNSRDFSFVDTLGSFINNYEYGRGFREYEQGLSSKYAYIWNVLSAIGQDYGRTIYENVVNYLDNVSNVDLCKVKALQSMLKIIGMNYDVIDSFDTIPVEVANLIDVLSINKSYLLDSKVFAETFKADLSAAGCIIDSKQPSNLSNELADPTAEASDAECSSYQQLGKYYCDRHLIDEQQYDKFLQSVFTRVLSSYVYLQYVDAEYGLPAEHTYIYEYIKDDLRGEQYGTDDETVTAYDQQIQNLKIKYNISKDFNQQQIVDDIENGIDSFDRYNIYQQEILQHELERREATYAYNKQYVTTNDKFFGYNLTRYSYYREKKVREYFQFIENTYNNLLIDGNAIASLNSENNVISAYQHDANYFIIDQNDKKYLLEYDAESQQLLIQNNYIIEIAKLLATYTLQIADVREHLKIQMQKNYMRGTFLLISYVVNEFLKYNISDKYGDMFSTEDTNVPLRAFLDSAYSAGDNVELIEYYDPTEYFNITTEHDTSALYGETANEKFWDNFYNKIGVNTNDLPLNAIEDFYMKQLKLEKNSVSELTNFLSIIFEYGANKTYIYDQDTNDSMQHGDFVCKIRDGRWIGDPGYVLKKMQENIVSVNMIYDDLNKYVQNGYVISIDTIANQISNLTSWMMTTYYPAEISSANEKLKESIYAGYDSNYENLLDIAEDFQEISSRYETLKSNSKYSCYLSAYREPDPAKAGNCYFYDKLSTFEASCDHGIIWNNQSVSSTLTSLLGSYNDLSSQLYTKIFKNQVWLSGNSYYTSDPSYSQYWPQYSPNYQDELTSVTGSLKSYLVSQVDVNKQIAQQHLQTHYQQLLGFKDELNAVLKSCNDANAKLEAYILGVEARTGTDMHEDLKTYKNITYWSEQVNQYKAVEDTWKDDEGLKYKEYVKTLVAENAFWLTDVTSFVSLGLNESDSIETKLEKLADRTNYPKFAQQFLRTNRLIVFYDLPDYGPCTSAKEVQGYSEEFTDWDPETGKGKDKKKFYDDPQSVPDSYEVTSTIAYDLDTATYPWHTDADEDIANEIRSAYSTACDNLTANVQLINSELGCLGIGEIPESSPTMDSVLKDAKSAYSELITKITTLENYIYPANETAGWWALADRRGYPSDQNLYPYRDRIEKIYYLNDMTSANSGNICNIQYIDMAYSQLETQLEQLLNDNQLYFSEYFPNGTYRYDQRISAMLQYVSEKDERNRAEVLEELQLISADYDAQTMQLDLLAVALKRDEVVAVNDDYSYRIQQINYTDELKTTLTTTYHQMKRYVDYVLSGPYINNYTDKYSPYLPYEKMNGTLNWLHDADDGDNKNAYLKFEDSAIEQINKKIEDLPAYKFTIKMLELAKSKFISDKLQEKQTLPQTLLDVIEKFQSDEVYISSQISVYNANKEVYLKYNGTEIGYDPFYNYKNQAYSSYQIHPYLYNFVEKSNLAYPLANNFFVAFNNTYEQDLFKQGIDQMVGSLGNVINVWKNELFDWTSYQSKYEVAMHTMQQNSVTKLPVIAYTGAFFPPALDAFLADPEGFMQDVQDDIEQSYYYHLNLTNVELERIISQLHEYEPAIRELVQRRQGVIPQLSTEFDIYKFAEDANGNSLFLYKSYSHLYEKHRGDAAYKPTYNEKKNTPGELWMRLKNHPIAFPAFDLRTGFRDISQYNIDVSPTSNGSHVNDYIERINDHFSNLDNGNPLKALTRDLVGRNAKTVQKQYLRCFMDMELDPTKRAVLLTVPYCTGSRSDEFSGLMTRIETFTYANSSIIVGNLTQVYDYDNNQHICNFTKDSNINSGTAVNIDNIANPGILYVKNGNVTSSNRLGNIYYEFIGFAKSNNYIFALFARKYLATRSFISIFQTPTSRAKRQPNIELAYSYYKYGTVLNDKSISVNDLKYDIFTTLRGTDIEQGYNMYAQPMDDAALRELYKYAGVVATTSNNETVTLGFVSQRLQDNAYADNTQIVNFVEYNATMMQQNQMSSTFGKNANYPRDTALLQTDDSQHINIYNSFDSFVQHLVNVKFKVSGSNLRYDSTMYFNLNSDLGFLPQYADRCGLSRYFNNTALKNLSSYQIELLGPENSDVKFTPVIKNPDVDESYGRVVEEYKPITQFTYYTEELSIDENAQFVSAEYDLTSIIPLSTYIEMQDTDALLGYKYFIINTQYESVPVLKGALSAEFPLSNLYLSSEQYDILSGQDVIGPNNCAFQHVGMTNHINNISAICTHIMYDPDTLLPVKIRLSCFVRQTVDDKQVIPARQFAIMIYKNHALDSYKYYHLMENSNPSKSSEFMTEDENYNIDFENIGPMSALSEFEINGKKPFQNYSSLSSPLAMSALLEFKYSEEETVNREFPYLSATDVEDEVVTLENKDQYIYFIAFDSYDTLQLNPFYMERYYPNSDGTGTYGKVRINTNYYTYKDFYDRAMQIEVTYNMERDDAGKFGVVMYFNYKNYTSPSYVEFIKNGTKPPSGKICSQESESLKNTYLVLKPGESGRLDMRVDYVFYDKLRKTDISQSIVGAKTDILRSYYIMNVSDSKPKFVIRKTPFVAEMPISDPETYELLDKYQDGILFRYFRIVIYSNRGRGGSGAASGNAKYVSFSEIEFIDKNEHSFAWPDNITELKLENIESVVGYTPKRLLDGNTKTKFLGTTVAAAEGKPLQFPIKIGFDLGSQCLDVKRFNRWRWYNPDNAKTHYGYLPAEFQLEFSNDKRIWFATERISAFDLPTGNEQPAYTGNIELV